MAQVRAKPVRIEELKAVLKAHAQANSLTVDAVELITWDKAVELLGRRDFSRAPLHHASRRLAREMRQEATKALAVQLQEHLRTVLHLSKAVCVAKYGFVFDDPSGIRRHTITIDPEPLK